MSEGLRTIDPSECWVRHIKRADDGQAGAVELGRGTFIAAPLDGVNGRGGWQSAQITAVLSDDGDVTVRFPNTEGDDGILHRRRFAIRRATGAPYRPGEEWLEFYREPHDLLAVATPATAELSTSELTLKCWTVATLLNRFRSTDFDVWDGAPPRDAFAHYTRATTLVYGDDLTGIDAGFTTGVDVDDWPGANGHQYLLDTAGAATAIKDPATGQPQLRPDGAGGIVSVGTDLDFFYGDSWVAEATFRASGTIAAGAVVTLHLETEFVFDGTTYHDPMLVVPLDLTTGDAPLADSSETSGQVFPGKRVGLVAEGLHSIRVIAFREWLFVMVDGELANSLRRVQGTTPGGGLSNATPTRIRLEATGPATITYRGFTVTALAPLAIADPATVDSDVEPPRPGDSYLPGLPPGGGLRLRTYDATRGYDISIFGISRAQMLPYLYGTGTEPASDGQVSDLNARSYRTGLVSTACASGIFTGAIRVDDLGIRLRVTGDTNVPNAAQIGLVRIYIAGVTVFNNFDTHLPDADPITGDVWPQVTPTLGELLYSDLDSADWPADQWFPIKLETRCGPTGGGFVTLERETAPGSGVWEAIPNGDLSPLGTYDAEHRNESHRTILGDVADTFGYQWRVEPRSLESGEFPGQIVPRVRAGRDYSLVLDVDDGTDFVSTVDAGDVADRLVADAAGLADPSGGGQLSAELIDFDNATLQAFLSSNYESVSDITVLELLIRRLNSLLGLRSAPNETVGVRPRGQRDLSKPPGLFPLTGTAELEKTRWLPGDALRLSIEPLDVLDRTPRQLTRVVTAIYPDGVTPPQVGLRDRPRDATTLLRRLLRVVLAPQRTYQGQLAFIPGALGADGIFAAAAADTYSRVAFPINPANVVGAWVVVLFTSSDPNGEGSIELNGIDTGIYAASAGWYDVKTHLDRPAGGSLAYARLINGTGLNYELNLVLLVRT